MIGIYHSRDLDGWTSGAIMKKAYPDIELIGYDYGQPFFWEKIKDIPGKDVKVFMADVSLPRKDMTRLAKMCDLTWLDHHASAIDELDGLKSFEQVTDPKISACEICWGYFFPNVPVPINVTYLGLYDSFRSKGTGKEKTVLQHQYGARQVAANPEEAKMFLQTGNELSNQLIRDGKVIYSFLCKKAWEDMKNLAFEMMIDKKKFLLINQDRLNPVNFGINYHKMGYDGFGCFWYVPRTGKWHWSLYNDNGKLDVSKLCKKRGGGGHKGAAGFVEDDLFEKI